MGNGALWKFTKTYPCRITNSSWMIKGKWKDWITLSKLISWLPWDALLFWWLTASLAWDTWHPWYHALWSRSITAIDLIWEDTLFRKQRLKICSRSTYISWIIKVKYWNFVPEGSRGRTKLCTRIQFPNIWPLANWL